MSNRSQLDKSGFRDANAGLCNAGSLAIRLKFMRFFRAMVVLSGKQAIKIGKQGSKLMKSKISVLEELKTAVARTDYWFYLGFTDIRRKYARTSIGYIWSILNSLIFIATIGIVYSIVLNIELEKFVPHFSISYFIWIFITSCVNESSPLFYSHGIVLKTSRINPSMLLMRIMSKNTIILMQNMVISFLIIIYFNGLKHEFELALIGVILLVAALFPLCFTIALVVSRYHDVEHIIQNLLILVFFVSPILWLPTQLTADHQWMVQINPVYHFLEIVRAPLLSGWPSLLSYAVCTGVIVLLWAIALFTYSRTRTRLTQWI